MELRPSPIPLTRDGIYIHGAGQGHVRTVVHTCAIDACVIRVYIHRAR